jgi:hypothetical protein
MKLVWSALRVPSWECHESQGCTNVGFSKRNSRRTLALRQPESPAALPYGGGRRSDVPRKSPTVSGNIPARSPALSGINPRQSPGGSGIRRGSRTLSPLNLRIEPKSAFFDAGRRVLAAGWAYALFVSRYGTPITSSAPSPTPATARTKTQNPIRLPLRKSQGFALGAQAKTEGRLFGRFRMTTVVQPWGQDRIQIWFSDRRTHSFEGAPLPLCRRLTRGIAERAEGTGRKFLSKAPADHTAIRNIKGTARYRRGFSDHPQDCEEVACRNHRTLVRATDEEFQNSLIIHCYSLFLWRVRIADFR